MRKTQKRNSGVVSIRRGLERKKTAQPRPVCAFTQRILAMAEPMVMIEDTGVKVYVGVDAFFHHFVLDAAYPNRNRKTAAAKIPGLVSCNGPRGIAWKLSYRIFAKKANVSMVEKLLSKVGDETPLRRRVCGADERARFIGNG